MKYRYIYLRSELSMYIYICIDIKMKFIYSSLDQAYLDPLLCIESYILL